MLYKFEDEGWGKVALYTLIGIGIALLMPLVIIIIISLLMLIFIPSIYDQMLMINIIIWCSIIGILCAPFFVFSLDEFQIIGPLGSFLSALWNGRSYSITGSGDDFILYALLFYMVKMVWALFKLFMSLMLIIFIPAVTIVYYLYSAPIRYFKA